MPTPFQHKLAEAVRAEGPPTPAASPTGGPTQAPAPAAEQIREAQESARAHDAEASIRDRMVNIGRAGQQAGRHNKTGRQK